MAVIRSSDLDFDTIKANLKTHFQKKSEFSGYNFEGAGLNNILDVLAYNTHLNGLIANIATNETFLQSSQLRSSVVSHAENLGYSPKSKTASKATVTLTLDTLDEVTQTLTLAKNTEFTGSADGVSYTFQTLEDVTATNNGSGDFSFLTAAGSANIDIKEGAQKTKTFLVGETTEDQVYVLPDTDIDTTTLTVDVFESVTSDTVTDSYTNVNNSVRINPTSTVFILRETPNGFYELVFSDGTILGKAPSAGNKIEVKYLTTKGAEANDITTFAANSVISTGGQSYTLQVATQSNSAGGSAKESIDSIKLNAPTNFTAQQRMVTSEDYKALISERFSSLVKDVTAWGGQDNVPKKFGTVFVSLNFKDNISSTDQADTKAKIVSELSDNLAVLSIDTEFADPEDLFLETTTTFNFDPDLTNVSNETQQATVDATIANHFVNKLNTFDKVFRRSALLTEIDSLSKAILDSTMTLKVQLRLTPTMGVVKNYTMNFPVQLAQPSFATRILESSRFTFNGIESRLINKPDSLQLQVVNNSSGGVLQDNAGTYNPLTGVVSIVGVNIAAVVGTFKVSVIPEDQSTIRPLRQYIIKHDNTVSASSAIIDNQNTKTTI